MSVFRKDPDVDKTFGVNWASYLGNLTIEASTWTLPAGVTEADSDFTDTTTSIQLSGGTDGTDYELVNTVTLSNDDTEERTITIQVRKASGSLTEDEIVTLAEIIRESYSTTETAASSLNVNQVAKVREDITTWDSGDYPLRNSFVKLKGGSSGVHFDNAEKRAAIFYRLRLMLGLDFVSYDLKQDVLELVELEVGANFG